MEQAQFLSETLLDFGLQAFNFVHTYTTLFKVQKMLHKAIVM